VLFKCNNSVAVQQKIMSPYSGVGLENIKKRLDLLYNDSYQLKIEELESEFKVLLKIPINED